MVFPMASRKNLWLGGKLLGVTQGFILDLWLCCPSIRHCWTQKLDHWKSQIPNGLVPGVKVVYSCIIMYSPILGMPQV